jgi:hypothetical protein
VAVDGRVDSLTKRTRFDARYRTRPFADAPYHIAGVTVQGALGGVGVKGRR